MGRHITDHRKPRNAGGRLVLAFAGAKQRSESWQPSRNALALYRRVRGPFRSGARMAAYVRFERGIRP